MAIELASGLGSKAFSSAGGAGAASGKAGGMGAAMPVLGGVLGAASIGQAVLGGLSAKKKREEEEKQKKADFMSSALANRYQVAGIGAPGEQSAMSQILGGSRRAIG